MYMREIPIDVYLREDHHYHHFTMLTVDMNKQSWETGYKVIREVAKTDGK